MENNGFALKVFQQEVCNQCECEKVLDPNSPWIQEDLFTQRSEYNGFFT